MVPPTSFLVGREQARAALHSHLDEGILLVSGTGGAGIGVTALARRLAADAAGQYPDGCVEVDLRGGKPGHLTPLAPEAAQRHVLRTLVPGMPIPESSQALRKHYQQALAEHKLLLILDDAANASQLRYLLPRKGTAVIVTSQTDLAASLPKLHALTLSGLAPEEACRLMIQAAPDADEFSRRRLRRLSAALNGVPLALRIVAPLLGPRPRLSPRKAMGYLAHARDRISAIRGAGSETMPVDSALEVAYELLDPALKPHFEALAVFPAPFDARAAGSVWDVPNEAAARLLAQFARLGLVDVLGPGDRYAVHALVRHYAQELLLGQPEQTRELVSRYAAHYLREAIQASSLLDAPTEVAPRPRPDLAVLWQHVPVAWARAVGEDPGWPKPQGMNRWICDFPPHSKALLDAMLTRTELVTWLQHSLDAAEAIGDARAIGSRLGELGRVYVALEAYDQALAAYERQLAVARESEALDIEGEALMNAGLAYGSLGDLKQAAASWQRSLRVFELSGDPRAARVRTWLQELQNRARG